MQIIDSLEVARRGPYGGGVGLVGFTGEMDMALALRTMARTPHPPPHLPACLAAHTRATRTAPSAIPSMLAGPLRLRTGLRRVRSCVVVPSC